MLCNDQSMPIHNEDWHLLLFPDGRKGPMLLHQKFLQRQLPRDVRALLRIPARTEIDLLCRLCGQHKQTDNVLPKMHHYPCGLLYSYSYRTLNYIPNRFFVVSRMSAFCTFFVWINLIQVWLLIARMAQRLNRSTAASDKHEFPNAKISNNSWSNDFLCSWHIMNVQST